jgi:hypothetical protein
MKAFCCVKLLNFLFKPLLEARQEARAKKKTVKDFVGLEYGGTLFFAFQIY